MGTGADGHPEGDARQLLAQLRALVAAQQLTLDALGRSVQSATDRLEANEDRALLDRYRLDALESRADADRVLIAELQAAGVLREEMDARLQVAVRSSRRVGVAVGMIMAARHVAEEEAFELLREASHRVDRPVRVVADEIVQSRSVDVLRRQAH